MSESGARRILMTADAVGGVWTYALDLARGLAREGVLVDIAVLGPSPKPDQRVDAGAVKGLTLHDTGLPLDWAAEREEDVLAAGEAIADLARSLGVDLVHLNNPPLAAQARFDRPLVVACHSCVATWWGAVRGDEPLPADFGFGWRTRLTGQGYARADALVAPTHAFALSTQRCYALPKTPLVVPNGRAPLAAAVSQRIETDSVFSAGRLWDESKNMATLERVASRLAVPVRVAGDLDGPNGAHAGFTHMETLGRLSERAIAERLSQRPVYASLALYEPFGLATLEAAQAGCALVLSDIPTFRELWADAALFAPARDDRAAAEAIERLIADPDARMGLGDAARARAAGYSLEGFVAGIDAIYRHLMRQSRPEPAPERP